MARHAECGATCFAGCDECVGRLDASPRLGAEATDDDGGVRATFVEALRRATFVRRVSEIERQRDKGRTVTRHAVSVAWPSR